MSKLLNISMLLLVLALICPAPLPVQASTEFDNTLLQYTGGGHLLGFSEGEFYAATGGHVLKMEFVNGLAVQPVAESAGYGRDAAPLDKVTYNRIWKDIDIAYTSAADGIAESTYYLKTPASVESIRLRYNRPVSLDGQGNLVISFENGNMVESAPVAWQETGGQRTPVQANYVIYAEQEVGFTLAGCQSDVAVIIDPTLSWNTFLGSNLNDSGNAIAVDAAGNVYVTGTSDATWGAPVRAFASKDDAFVAKLNNSGVLIWNTFLGGSEDDMAWGIALDPGGNIYITGSSFGTWGVAPKRIFSDYSDAFVARLSNDGAFVWNTFLGSTGPDGGYGIVTDATGNIYVTGSSFSTWGAPVWDPGGHHHAFVAKLTGSGDVTWNTFMGGTGEDAAFDIAVGTDLNVYIAGYSDVAWGAPKRAYSSGFDGFAAKLNSIGALQWNTFFGTAGYDDCGGITVDATGNSYVTGGSNATWGNPVRPFSADGDGYVAKLDGSGNLIWNTFLGGSGEDDGASIAIDPGGNLYIAGSSNITWGNPDRPFTPGLHPVYGDGFAARLSNNGLLLWNTFLGGSGWDSCSCVAIDARGNTYVSGNGNATWGSPVRAYTYGMTTGPEPAQTADAFAARIGNPPTITSFTPASGGSGTVVTITGNYFLGATVVSFGGTAATSFTVNSDTQITATVGSGATGRITVTTPSGTGTSAADFSFINLVSLIGTTRPHGSSMPGLTAALPQSPVILPTVSVRSASLSATKVAPGTAITVTADVVNTGMVNGSSSIKVYVNGELENSRGITVNSGGSTPITFTVIRNEPGTYSVYVGGTQAGSFTVDQFADPNIILYISGALILFAFAIGVIYVTGRRQPGR